MLLIETFITGLRLVEIPHTFESPELLFLCLS